MAEWNVPQKLCGYLNGAAAVEILPETWREGCAALWLTGGGSHRREYVDGSAMVEIPFEIRIRCEGNAAADRLRALDFFASLGDYIGRVSLMEEAEETVAMTSCASKSAVFEDGSEEYRASFAYRFLKKKDVS